jgi:uncharacterized protein
MITLDLIKSIILDWQEQKLPLIIPRSVTLPLNTNEIVTVIGPRRSGKTYLLFKKIEDLLTAGTDINDLIYLNFEDERLYGMKIQELDLILQAVRQLDSEGKIENKYFFFDEIQNIVGWEKFIRRMDDTISKNTFITGSNSKLLSSEIATSLRGRTIKTEVFPLSFQEFLNFKKVKVNSNSSSGKVILLKNFEEYLQIGGFPRIVLNQDNYQRVQILQEYYNVMIQKDISERYNINNQLALKFFCNQIVNNHAGIISINKIFNAAKSSQIKVSLETYYSFFEYLQNVYLIGVLNKYNTSIRTREISEKKIYLIDNGMYNAINQSPNKNTGKLLEAVIYNHLMQIYSNESISFYKGLDFECDFVTHKKGQVMTPIQVTVEMYDEKTKEREINGLIKTCKILGLNSGLIITLNTEDEYVIDGIQVIVTPAWKYLQVL